MKKFLRVPVASGVVGPVWLDLEMSINAAVEGISRSYGLIKRNYAKLDDKILKEAKEYQKLSKSIQKVIKKLENEVYR